MKYTTFVCPSYGIVSEIEFTVSSRNTQEFEEG